MKLFVILLALLAAQGDARVAWLAAQAVPIRSVDPADGDFRDLEPLRKSLRGVRVVLLGETDHGDGTTFLAKTRMIRFLHERMGFDVLVFESSLYECAKVHERLAAGEPVRQALPRCVFPIWTKSREFQPLIDYLDKHPMEIAGVDNQFSGTAADDFFVHDLAAVLGPEVARGDDWDRVVRVVAKLNKGVWEEGSEPRHSAEEQAAFARTIESWRSRTGSEYWRLVLANLRVFAEQTWQTDFRDHTANALVYAMRDRQMGANLLWLARQRYPRRKIIVWSAVLHNGRNLGAIETSDARQARLYGTKTAAGQTVWQPMGEVAWRVLGDQVYSMAFTAYQGEFARFFAPKAQPLPAMSGGSLEGLLARAGFDAAFVDLRHGPSWLHAPLPAQLTRHIEMRADWSRVVDGVFFFKTMERAHKQ